MSTTPKPRPSGRARKPRVKPKPEPAAVTRLSAADRKLVEKLVRKGLMIVPPDWGKPLTDDDLQPGPPDPEGRFMRQLIEDRR